MKKSLIFEITKILFSESDLHKEMNINWHKRDLNLMSDHICISGLFQLT